MRKLILSEVERLNPASNKPITKIIERMQEENNMIESTKELKELEMNLNELSDKITNFKIKFTEKPSPIQISNMNLLFFIDRRAIKFDRIMFDSQTDSVIIEFNEGT